ncbi:TonB-dependent receptor [Sphingosinicella rhizophila]|uniref:TonB-dependent receptor n=1 Tax=Sphingosinicella rhizophila TaxID=3050082 RepID=A0ABU3Q2R4_9SPHN|nr:TonB-dependent receptor [Sphingosinicella sp. GR2756]MDT9597364.1 TonB-dependent receptor [Sphingosinicella sp. GR2756]
MIMRLIYSRSLAVGTAVVWTLAAAPAAYAQATYSFNLPAQELGKSLRAVARKTGSNIVFEPVATRGRKAPALKGGYSAAQAVERLLTGSGLSARQTSGGSWIVSPLRTASLVETSATSSVVATPAAAQDEGAPARANTADDAADPEIVVTATRREQSILDVPISVEAYSQETLDQKGVRNVEDLVRMTPGVTIETSAFNSKFIAIRGLFSATGATMTGVYIDDTPVQVRTLVLATNFYPAMFDLERVEVLRGPQGTLFGAGAMGGAVRFITAKPGLTEYSGSARAELALTEGGDPSYEAGIAVGGPIIQDKLGFRISGYHRRDGGFVDRIPYVADRGTPEENSNARETTVLNAALTFAPTDRLTITPSVFYQKLRRDDTEQFWQLLDNPLVPRPQIGRFVNGEGRPSSGNDEAAIYSLKTEYDLGGASIISNTSYLDRNTDEILDSTSAYQEVLGSLAVLFGAPPVYFDTPFGGLENSTITNFWTQRTFTQELRLQSNSDADRLSYVFGLFYQNARQTSLGIDYFPEFVAWQTAAYGFPLLGAPDADDVIALDDNATRDRQYAVFGDLSYKLTDRLTVSAGVRVSHMKFDFFQLRSGAFYGGEFVTNGRTSETPITPKFALQYEPSPDWMVYASAAKGFRQGGANPLANTTTCAADLAELGIDQVPGQYRSDSVWSYELGAKGRAGRTLTLAASVFNIDWKDIQQPRSLQNCAHLFIDNLGKARSRGFDAKIIVMPARGLTFDIGIGYMDTTFRETILTQNGQDTIVEKGDRFAVPWIVTLAADYQTALGFGDLTGYYHIQYDYRSSFGANPDNVDFNPITSRTDEQHFVAARLGVRRGPLDVSLFVNNLLNSQDDLSRLQWIPGSDRVLTNTYRPRTFGITGGYRF